MPESALYDDHASLKICPHQIGPPMLGRLASAIHRQRLLNMASKCEPAMSFLERQAAFGPQDTYRMLWWVVRRNIGKLPGPGRS